MGIVVQSRCWINDPHGIKPSDDLRIDIRYVGTMELDHLGHLATDRIDGIQRGGGLLEDIGNLTPTHLAQFGIGGLEQILPLKHDIATLIDCWGRGEKSCDRESCHTLAATALTDYRKSLSTADFQGDSFDGWNHSIRGGESDL